MAHSYVAFDLIDGYVQNYLVAGPQALSLEKSVSKNQKEDAQNIAQSFFDEKSGVNYTPVEVGPLDKGKFLLGDYQGEWTYYRCREDHRVDLSTKYTTTQYLRAWAFTQIVSTQAQTVDFSLQTFGPVDVWVNKKPVFHSVEFSRAGHHHSFSAPLKKGGNQLIVRFASIAAPEAILAFSLRIQSDGVSVRIPTLIPSINRRNELESVNEEIYFDRDIYYAKQKIRLCWPDGSEKATYQAARLLNKEGFIYGQAEDIGKPGSVVTFTVPETLEEGEYRGFVTPLAWEYYESNIRVTKSLPIWSTGRNIFSESPYGTPEERREEALTNAARRGGNLFAEVAKLALDAWSKFEPGVVQAAVETVNEQAYGSEVQLLGLLGLLSRFGENPEFPADLADRIQSAALDYNYLPNLFSQEDQNITIFTCQILAGQAFPDATFKAMSMNGNQLREHGEANALSWMRSRALYGFSAWDSTDVFANHLTALSNLVDQAESEEVFELASVLMDKILFSIALNSHRGVFGSTQGRATTENIKSGLAEATSGVTRLLYGMGIFNYHIESTVSVALMKNYEFPPIIAEIAVRTTEPIWNREQHGQGQHAVNKVSYRASDFMLSSVQDYRQGERGEREHLWQATFGPQAVVFVNHPGNSYQNDSHTPGYWLGNGTLPRIAQWKDLLVALYRIPEEAPLDYTHAYFPTYEFDEYLVEGNTAFARKGDGYLALSASQGVELLTIGPTAYRELRSYGRENAWVCQMGSYETDGDFSAFQEKVKGQTINTTNSQAELQSLRGDHVQFSWNGSFLLNDEELKLNGYKHYDNPFTTTELGSNVMEIRTESYLLRLDYREEI